MRESKISNKELGKLVTQAMEECDRAPSGVCAVPASVLYELCLELMQYRSPHLIWPNSKPKLVKK